MGIRDPKWGVWLPECSLLLRLWTCCWSSRTWAVSSSFMSLSFWKVKMKKVLKRINCSLHLLTSTKFLFTNSPDISSNIIDIFSILCGKWNDQHTWFSEVVFVSLSRWALCWSGVIRSEASYSSHCGGTNKRNHNNVTDRISKAMNLQINLICLSLVLCYIHILLSVYFQNEFLKFDNLQLKTFNTCMMGIATFYKSAAIATPQPLQWQSMWLVFWLTFCCSSTTLPKSFCNLELNFSLSASFSLVSIISLSIFSISWKQYNHN